MMGGRGALYALAAILLIAVAAYAYPKLGSGQAETLERINSHMEAGGFYLNLAEETLIAQFGEGEYIEGFGGHVRAYAEPYLRVGIAGDRDNDFYGAVSWIEWTNPQYAIYGIHVGESSARAADLLVSQGYERMKDVDEMFYENGEYLISLYGSPNVEQIRVGFEDKDLRDRNY